MFDRITIALGTLAVLVCVGVGMGTAYMSCSARATKMAMNWSWAPFQGCMIEAKPDQWIDINRYRIID